jgi:hypothetical protein
MTGEREERESEEKIMPSLMATSLRWRTHSARTNIIHVIPNAQEPSRYLGLFKDFSTSIQGIFRNNKEVTLLTSNPIPSWLALSSF